MKGLRWLHRYIGAAIAALMFVIAVTGATLVFKEEIWRLRYPALRQELPDLTPSDHAAALHAIENRFRGSIRLVRLPQPGLPAYHVFLQGGEALVDPQGHEVIDRWAWNESLTGVLVELHMHLGAGRFGRELVGFLGLFATGMALSGVILWWPLRRQYRLSSMKPAGLARGQLIKLHRDLGATSVLFVLLFGLTGAAVVYGDASRQVLASVLGGGLSPARQKPAAAASQAVGAPPAQLIRLAREALPRGSLISWSPPPDGGAAHYFRFRLPGEAHPNGRSTVYVDAVAERVIQVFDATTGTRAERTVDWMYPLHAARIGGWPYRILALLAAISLAVISFSGLIGFIKAMRRRPKQP